MDKSETNKKMGRPKKPVPEKQFYGICCTEGERIRVERKINRERLRCGKITVSEFFLRAIGVRH